MLNVVMKRCCKFAAVVLMIGLSGTAAADPDAWSSEDIYEINKLSIAELPVLPPDPSNHVSDDPRAAALGKALFDRRFSANGAVSCSSCHMPDHQFQDGLSLGHGIAEVAFRTMPLAGSAYHPFLFWDGRKDSLWSQALGPLENVLEHGGDRTMVGHLIAAHYRVEYEAVFGSLPDFDKLPQHASPAGNSEAVAAWQALTAQQQHDIDLAFANIGKSIEAYERTIPVPKTRFDAFAAAFTAQDMATADKLFNDAERRGLKLFILKAGCTGCHAGPLLTDSRFHNIGLPGATAATSKGRSAAVYILKGDPFNCYGEFSDTAPPKGCIENKLIRYGLADHLAAYKTPSLRGVSQRPPYMHNGQFKTLKEVLQHYNKAPKASFGDSELVSLQLSEQQLSDIEAFLLTLAVEK
jgi:cytochrome c peroxidase